jgi:hypothetical protein
MDSKANDAGSEQAGVDPSRAGTWQLIAAVLLTGTALWFA